MALALTERKKRLKESKIRHRIDKYGTSNEKLPNNDWADYRRIMYPLADELYKLSDNDRALILAFIRAKQNFELPEKAPEKYSERTKQNENLMQFLDRIYYDKGYPSVPLSYLRKNDMSAYQAINNWKKSKKPLTCKTRLHRRGESIDEAVEEIVPNDSGFQDTVEAWLSFLQSIKLRV